MEKLTDWNELVRIMGEAPPSDWLTRKELQAKMQCSNSRILAVLGYAHSKGLLESRVELRAGVDGIKRPVPAYKLRTDADE